VCECALRALASCAMSLPSRTHGLVGPPPRQSDPEGRLRALLDMGLARVPTGAEGKRKFPLSFYPTEPTPPPKDASMLEITTIKGGVVESIGGSFIGDLAYYGRFLKGFEYRLALALTVFSITPLETFPESPNFATLFAVKFITDWGFSLVENYDSCVIELLRIAEATSFAYDSTETESAGTDRTTLSVPVDMRKLVVFSRAQSNAKGVFDNVKNLWLQPNGKLRAKNLVSESFPIV